VNQFFSVLSFIGAQVGAFFLGSFAGVNVGVFIAKEVSGTIIAFINQELWTLVFYWSGALGLMARFIAAHTRFTEVRKEKRRHSRVFFEARRVNFIRNQAALDFVWTYLYTTVESAVVVAVFLFTTTFFTHLLFPWLWYFGFLAALYAAIPAVYVAHFLTGLVFEPTQVKEELEDAPLILKILRKMGLLEDDDDNQLPPGGVL
jgi:MFS family permease